MPHEVLEQALQHCPRILLSTGDQVSASIKEKGTSGASPCTFLGRPARPICISSPPQHLLVYRKFKAVADQSVSAGFKLVPSAPHTPVLLDEVLDFFADLHIQQLVDGTLGAGSSYPSCAYVGILQLLLWVVIQHMLRKGKIARVAIHEASRKLLVSLVSL